MVPTDGEEMAENDIALSRGRFGLVVRPAGGAIRRFFLRRDEAELPLLVPPADGVACFPLVPFGNRLRGNRFVFEGVVHRLVPNTPADPHYLHGDGWLAPWQVAGQDRQAVHLRLVQRSDVSPYAYLAEQVLALGEDGLALTLSVVNQGAVALPFGLGWHPFLPLTATTTLQARACSRWAEDRRFLPTARQALEPELDFTDARPLPRRWLNSCFEGWDGRAEIAWPEHGLTLQLATDPPQSRFVLFVSDPAFEPGYRYQHFCFEPMSHSVGAHHLPDNGGLVRLAPGERLSATLHLRCRQP